MALRYQRQRWDGARRFQPLAFQRVHFPNRSRLVGLDLRRGPDRIVPDLFPDTAYLGMERGPAREETGDASGCRYGPRGYRDIRRNRDRVRVGGGKGRELLGRGFSCSKLRGCSVCADTIPYCVFNRYGAEGSDLAKKGRVFVTLGAAYPFRKPRGRACATIRSSPYRTSDALQA